MYQLADIAEVVDRLMEVRARSRRPVIPRKVVGLQRRENQSSFLNYTAYLATLPGHPAVVVVMHTTLAVVEGATGESADVVETNGVVVYRSACTVCLDAQCLTQHLSA
jgi:hypothetical protein